MIIPEISSFYGIAIATFCAPKEHNPPHFHAIYGDYRVVIDIRTAEVIKGTFPKKQLRLVVAWTELHTEELLANWKLAIASELPSKIEPLR